MNDLLIRIHMGLGDSIIANAIVRHYAEKHRQVVVLCKQHNAATLDYLWRDKQNIETFSVNDDSEADDAAKSAFKAGFSILGLGDSKLIAFGADDFNLDKFDQEFYRIANLPFSDRWDKFVCKRERALEVPGVPDEPFCLIHDDPKRGYAIKEKHLPDMQRVRIEPGKSKNLFAWWNYIEEAEELHFIDSSPIIIADSLPELTAKKLVFHAYARPCGRPPTYRKPWLKLLA